MASIHRSWVEREEELLGLGAHDRTLEARASDIRDSLSAIELSSKDRVRLERVVPELERLLLELGAAGLPHTLVHGDLHPGNLMMNGDGLRIFDWSDTCVSYPLFDLPTFLEWVEDEAVREAMLETYMASWSDVASVDELRRLYQLALPLAHVHHAISYTRINAALEPDDGWWFAGEPARWLRGALDLVEAL